MIKPMLTADARVEMALSKFTHDIPAPVRDLMVSLVRETEVDCAITAIVEAATASALANGIVKSAAKQAMAEFSQFQPMVSGRESSMSRSF